MVIGSDTSILIGAEFIGESNSRLIYVAFKMEDVLNLFLPTRVLDWLVIVESWHRVVDMDSW